MKELIFTDARKMEVQSVSVVRDGVLHIRTILTTTEQLKALFMDEFAAQKMTVRENHVEKECYENYNRLSYIKEEVGGIWEVEMLQKEKDTATLVKELSEKSFIAEKNFDDARKEIGELKEENKMLRDCMLEMSETVYQ